MDVTFAQGDEVECKAGIGTITYFEDGYMDIELTKDCSERSFFAPFEGKVWPYVKPVPVNELPLWDEILAKIPEITLAEAWMNSVSAGMAVRFLGGEAKDWKELSAYNKLNFVAVTTGCPLSIFKDAYESGNLDVLIERWCGRKAS